MTSCLSGKAFVLESGRPWFDIWLGQMFYSYIYYLPPLTVHGKAVSYVQSGVELVRLSKNHRLTDRPHITGVLLTETLSLKVVHVPERRTRSNFHGNGQTDEKDSPLESY